MSDTVDVITGDNESPSRGETRIQGKNGGTLTPFNSERARQAALSRWGVYRKAGEVGMVRGVLGEHVKATRFNAVEAYMQIVAKQAEAALTLNDNGTANTAAARFVREAIGADVGAPVKGGGEITANQVAIVVGDSALAALADVLRRSR